MGTSKIPYVIKSALFFVIAEGVRQSDLFRTDTSLSKHLVSITHLVLFIATLLIVGEIFIVRQSQLPYPVRRTIGILITIGISSGIILMFIEDINCMRYALAIYYAAGALCQLGLLMGIKFVKYFYYVHDLVCGHIIFVPLFVLGALQVPNIIQTWLLYHNALSSDVVVSDILRYARKSQEAGGGDVNDDVLEQLTELRKHVQRQEVLLESVGLGSQTASLKKDALKPALELDISRRPPLNSPRSALDQNPSLLGSGSSKRVMSLSGLDVWGDMTLGDAIIPDGIIPDGIPTYQDIGTVPSITRQQRASTVASRSGIQDFRFQQPDTMPPR